MTINRDLLTVIAQATAANQPVYVSKPDGLPMLQHTPPLIAVDTAQVDPNDANKVAAKITEAGVEYLNKPASTHTNSAINVQVGTGFVRPKVKRGGGNSGAPTKYPFDTLEIGQFFFIADSEVKGNDAFKTLGSAVGSANQRYSEGTGEKETVVRAKRGKDHKTIKNADGSNVTETVEVEKKRALRKFVVNKVEAGVKYGEYTAPANGAVALRIELPQ